jgi:hypothetical protein
MIQTFEPMVENSNDKFKWPLNHTMSYINLLKWKESN